MCAELMALTPSLISDCIFNSSIKINHYEPILLRVQDLNAFHAYQKTSAKPLKALPDVCGHLLDKFPAEM